MTVQMSARTVVLSWLLETIRRTADCETSIMSNQSKPPEDGLMSVVGGGLVWLICTPIGVFVLIGGCVAFEALVGPSKQSKPKSATYYDDGPSQQVYTPRGDW